jgi:hypothetical protein
MCTPNEKDNVISQPDYTINVIFEPDNSIIVIIQPDDNTEIKRIIISSCRVIKLMLTCGWVITRSRYHLAR